MIERIWEIVAARPEHIDHIAEHMRDDDIREVWALNSQTPHEAMKVSLESSVRAWTTLIEGRPAFMWGVSPAADILTFTGIPWLLATDDIIRVAPEFIRQSRDFVDRMQEGFTRLENHVHAGNSLSLRWLKWCGFTIDKTPVAFNYEPFFKFWRCAPCVL
ncbi:hypothetical protein C4J81_17130 [Deltaproteobacteria bacterium Smac51]|nr:hypothetical protein C4J81_17130 [Deltaproteobacteria bacterium Smac51]